MIGKVTWRGDGEELTATLHEDGRWECPGRPDDEAHLSAWYNEDDWPTGPSEGQPGHAALNDLARRRNGTAWFEPKQPDPPGTVY